MTDPHRDNPRNRQNVSEEDFAHFLKYLSPDTEEAGRLYERLHKNLTRYCAILGDSDPETAATLTIDRAILKIVAGAVVPDVGKYCRGIARNVVRERSRVVQREISAFNEFIEDRNNSFTEEMERIYSIMKSCFEKLAVEDQQLLKEYCKDLKGRALSKHRDALAKSLGKTMVALRIQVQRLRNKLKGCVKERLKNL